MDANATRTLLNGPNDTDYEDDTEDALPLHTKVVYGIVLPVMVITCVSGSILTIVAYCQDRKLRTIHNRYLMSLAVSDLLVGCVSMPFYTVYTLMDYTWPFGVIFCRIFLSIDYLACLESVFVIILISYDRCMLIRQGVQYSLIQTIKVVKIRLAISWTVAFLIYIPAIASWDSVRGYRIIADDDCEVEFFDNFAFTMITSVIEFFIPLLSIASLNLYLYTLIRKRTRNQTFRSAPTTDLKQPNQTNNRISGYEQTADNKRQTVAIRRERKAARSLAILVCVFAICWAPYTICTIVLAFCDNCINEDLYEAFTWLLWGNSTLNPFLYAFTSEQFRTNYIRLLHLQKICRLKRRVGPIEGQTEETL